MEKQIAGEEILALQEKAAQLAEENFMAGMNCAEAVLAAILKLGITDLPYETVSLASGLGGGVGGCGSICGAINGGALAIGAVHGRKNPTSAGDARACKAELHNKENGLYKYVAAYMNEIKDQTGSWDCEDLTKTYDMAVAEQRKARLFSCKSLVTLSAKTAIKYIAEKV